jgi:predicted membrane metal-binding protein
MKSLARLRPSSQAGGTLLDACAALALSSLAAATAISGARPLACAVRVGAARTALAGALLEARQEAYAAERNVLVEARVGESVVTLQPGGRIRALGDGARLTSVPADGNVQFRATGLADNATIAVACGAATASVVVNQRGVIR